MILRTKTATALMITGMFGYMLFSACSNSASNKEEATTPEPAASTAPAGIPSDPMSDKGVGPVSSVTLGPLDNSLADKGHHIFEAKCTACHKIDVKVVGPALAGVTKRRSPEWIMNMILDPENMTQNDPIAKELLGEYIAPMANQSLTQDEARSVLEFFRSNDK